VADPNKLGKAPGASLGERYTRQARLMGSHEAKCDFTAALSVEKPSGKNSSCKHRDKLST